MANLQKKKQAGRIQRRRRARSKIVGTASRPRLVVFRSLKHISVQAIDDNRGQTLAAVTDREAGKKLAGVEAAKAVGELVAKKLQTKKITAVVFDRNGYKYHGQVKALAEAARAGGLQF